MKTLIMLSVLIAGIVSIVPAQDGSDNKKKSRQERKKERQEKIAINFEITKDILENKAYILEAHTLNDRYGQSVPVSSTINFVEVDSTEAVIQTGNPYFVGYNGLGGVTAKGRITNYELIVNEKKKNFRVNLSVSTTIGMYDVQMYIDALGDASATLYGMRGKSITYHGDLVPDLNSKVYEGMTSY